jgi:hypothetical protein
MMFCCTIDGVRYPLALIQPYDVPAGPRRFKDEVLHLYRPRQKLRSSVEFISIHSIVRGALLVNVPGSPKEAFVIDVVDGDMYLRVKSIFTH